MTTHLVYHRSQRLSPVLSYWLPLSTSHLTNFGENQILFLLQNHSCFLLFMKLNPTPVAGLSRLSSFPCPLSYPQQAIAPAAIPMKREEPTSFIFYNQESTQRELSSSPGKSKLETSSPRQPSAHPQGTRNQVPCKQPTAGSPWKLRMRWEHNVHFN